MALQLFGSLDPPEPPVPPVLVAVDPQPAMPSIAAPSKLRIVSRIWPVFQRG